MTSLDEYEQRQIAEAIARVERRTDAELVTVLARRADDYAYLPLFWAAVLALVVPGLLQLLLGWPVGHGLLVANLLLFIGLCALLRTPRLNAWLVPPALRRWQASRLARQQFREQKLHCTAKGAGVLIFVAEAELHVEILVDQGIDCHLDAHSRAVIGARFAEQVRQGRTLQGFVECIEACGERLCEHVPRTHARNELPNRLVILE
ncbi:MULTISPECIES: TPM domain-containing protein [Pseudomonas]|jgi:putative membrane protein|uniref:Membrane protein n=1 Tax=Pseudomonas putida TaxID=303 RepID=A0A379KJM8_PSEPU|nr:MULTISPECIES: membrane protein [Pseudomonas]QPN46499.1 hypothetical protein I5S86_06265 [Priestia aryabhattai]MBG6124464.1 putative membrane protein [Pseudomonas sp. M2]MBM7399538.1 putative membrane protein [Pseudomonas sp. M5]NSX21438.1 hypothetical protein [Pseudomonas putida]NWC83962.1 hypothetical protein [Pseudomonas putida]